MNTLIYSMGNEADDILRSFGLSEDSKKYDTVVAKFESHFVKRRNVIFEWAKFNMRKQEEGEAVDMPSTLWQSTVSMVLCMIK